MGNGKGNAMPVRAPPYPRRSGPTSFLTAFLAELAAGLIVLFVGYLVVEHALDLRERRRSRLSVLKAGSW